MMMEILDLSVFLVLACRSVTYVSMYVGPIEAVATTSMRVLVRVCEYTHSSTVRRAN